MSVVVKTDLSTPVFAQGMTPKSHLEKGIKALRAGDSQGALM